MNEEKNKNFETRCGIVIAIFAAIMAMNDLVSGKYGDDEIIGTNEKAAAYNWYQAKSIKETLTEGEQSLLKSLLSAGVVAPQAVEAIKNHVVKLDDKIARYQKEKNEILKGSKAVGPDQWVQDVGGELGKVVGTQEMELRLNVLSQAGDRFDLASMLFQVCLVLGALSLILKREKMQTVFFFGMLFLGTLGTVISGWAFYNVL